MADQPHPLRVLQVIGDTDPTEVNRAALDLHRGLAAVGVEVRTLALAPGRRGGLDDVVPVMAPSRRSWTLRKVLDRERRWADVTVLHGAGAVVPAVRRRGDRPPLVALLDAGDHAPDATLMDGFDEIVVVDPAGTAAPPGTDDRITWLSGEVTAARWRELLGAHAVRSG